MRQHWLLRDSRNVLELLARRLKLDPTKTDVLLVAWLQSTTKSDLWQAKLTFIHNCQYRQFELLMSIIIVDINNYE